MVSSPQAAQGLGDVPPNILTVAETAESTIRGVCELFAEPARARAIGTAAGQWVRNTWRWERMYDRLYTLLLKLGVTFPQ